MRRLAPMLLAVVACAASAADEVKTPVADFEERLATYMKLHAAASSEASHNQTGVAATDQDKVLAEAIRGKRPDAAQGELFSATIATEFRRLIADSFRHSPKSIRASIRSGEMVAPQIRVNAAYPPGVPVQTMPPSLLGALPKLPDPLTYRIVGHSLLLLDAGGKLIVDYIPNAIPKL